MKCPYCGYVSKEQIEVCKRCKAAILNGKEKHIENDNDDKSIRVSKRKIRS